jgi:hypothetical protein
VPLFSRRARVAQQDAPSAPPGQVAADSAVSAVQRAVTAAYPDAEPRTLAVRAMPDRPFAGSVHAYPLRDHGLLVTDGLAGHGWPELTLRVSTDDLIGLPPAVPWPFQVLVFLANSAVSSGRGFGPASRLENSSPFNGDANATARCLIFTPDPHLLPGGADAAAEDASLRFLQVVPVTQEELAEAAERGSAEVTGRLADGNPLLIARLYA